MASNPSHKAQGGQRRRLSSTSSAPRRRHRAHTPLSGRNPELANNGTFWERWGRDVALAVNSTRRLHGKDGTGSVLVFNVGIHFNLGQGQSEAEAEFGKNYYRRVVREVCRGEYIHRSQHQPLR